MSTRTKTYYRTDDLRPPMRLIAGECSCSSTTNECLCAPEDLAQKISDHAFARVSANDARDRRDAAAERHWLAEVDRLGAEIRRATTPQPQHARNDAAMTTTDRPFTLRRFRTTKLGRTASTLRTTTTTAKRSDDGRGREWREQWRQPTPMLPPERAALLKRR